jgi:hypothetical protein
VISFLRARGGSLAVIVLVMFLISTTQGAISYSVGRGPLRELVPSDLPAVLAVLYATRIVLLTLLVLLWALKRKRALLHIVIVANIYFTLKLLLDTSSLIGVLGGFRQAAVAMLIDAALMSLSNILIFSIWYWIIDPPGIGDEPRAERPWAFLFPQRSASLPRFDRWSPGYPDYLFIAFTTSFAFSPTDALPLTRMAKMLMLLQAAVSVVIVVAIAGGAINALVGSA